MPLPAVGPASRLRRKRAARDRRVRSIEAAEVGVDRRTTTGKAALEPVVIGDPELGERLVAALSATEPVQRATHGFHTYPAGMHPDAAREIVRALPGSSVLDPF